MVVTDLLVLTNFPAVIDKHGLLITSYDWSLLQLKSLKYFFLLTRVLAPNFNLLFEIFEVEMKDQK